MGFRKGSIGSLIMQDLNQMKQDREMLLDDLKTKYNNDKDLDHLVQTICMYNTVISEFEHIIEIAKLNKSKGSK